MAMKRLRARDGQAHIVPPVLDVANFEPQSAAPGSATEGDVYFDDGTNTTTTLPGLRYYNGSVFTDIPGYTQGGWTPELYHAAVQVTTTDADGVYCRIGNFVMLWWHIVYTADITSGGTNALTIQNLPSVPPSNSISTPSVGPMATFQYFAAPANAIQMECRLTSTPIIRLYWVYNAGARTTVQASQSNSGTGNSKVLTGSVCYLMQP
jgi:hypothetical protein